MKTCLNLLVVALLSAGAHAAELSSKGEVSGLVNPMAIGDYRVGPEDKIEISMPFANEFKNAYEVDFSGDIDLPFAGRIHVMGMTTQEIQGELNARLAPYFVSPHALVSITNYGSRSVSVLGAVRNPGRHQLQGKRTLMDMLAASGGLAPEAGSLLIITRSTSCGPLGLPGAHLDSTGGFHVADVDLDSLMAGDPGKNIALCGGDSITVPKAKLIYVMGDVHRQGGFPLHENSSATALQALALAEGLDSTASPSHAKLFRKQPGNGTKEIPVNLSRILEHKDEDIPLQPDDLLYVPDSRSKKAAIRGMEAAIQMGTGIVIWRR
jgi:polysaccharide export outer membrane protein